MAAPVISISFDSLDESVGSSISRVILFGFIRIEVPVVPADLPVVPKVGAAAVASPTRVLELDIYSSSEPGPSEGSLPHVSVALMVSPFLFLDDSKSDTELPERHVSNVPSIYIQQFWNTLTMDTKTDIYSFQLDELWFTLDADLLRSALGITPKDLAYPFVAPPAGDLVINFVNNLGYPEEL
ncbi:hypothetical protein Tco_1429868 [Tanacetum coccineum]